MSYYNDTVIFDNITPKDDHSKTLLVNYLKGRNLTVEVCPNGTISCEGDFGEGGFGENGDLEDLKEISEKKIGPWISQPATMTVQCRNHKWTQSIYVTRFLPDGTSMTKFVSLLDDDDDWFDRFKVEIRN